MIQTINLNGIDYVLMPKTDYEATALGSDNECFPSGFVDALFSDDCRVKTWREYRKMTMTQLADEVGVSQSYISDIESGKKDGSIKVIKAIAEALNADIELII